MAIVVITGSNSGFGLAAALAFARNGDTVVATMRDPTRATTLREALAAEELEADVRSLDVTKAGTFADFFSGVVRDHGRVDVLVNNAGILRPGALEDISEEALRLTMETNAIAPLLLAKAVLPIMRKQEAGYIIMISSLSGIAGLPGDVAYTASKFALEGSTEALRHEIDRWGIKVALVLCGMYATGIFAASKNKDELLPAGYPMNSVYRPFVVSRLAEIHARLPEAFSPSVVGNLLVDVANSDGSRLRWSADPVAERVLATMFAHSDAERDEFLRNVGGSDWWSDGELQPPEPK
ncbi:MAG TPA: SDR family NAD(P)-dependent oxidoreductase [Woeseiaceae bacterium]|nr:SDR family NAD(P)-dependent oxidoreductase [Woeseiaceae bacterium]